MPCPLVVEEVALQWLMSIVHAFKECASEKEARMSERERELEAMIRDKEDRYEELMISTTLQHIERTYPHPTQPLPFSFSHRHLPLPILNTNQHQFLSPQFPPDSPPPPPPPSLVSLSPLLRPPPSSHVLFCLIVY